MKEENLIHMVATIWVKSGGDTEGLDFLYLKLKQKIKEKELNKREIK